MDRHERSGKSQATNDVHRRGPEWDFISAMPAKLGDSFRT
jgi:hypothetical protein